MRIGIIGYGNMSSAMLDGLLRGKAFRPSDVRVSSRTPSRMGPLLERWPGVITCHNNGLVAKNSDVLFICVRSEQVPLVMEEITPLLPATTHLVLINGGVRTSNVCCDSPISKVMPSITSGVCRGVTLIYHDDDVDSVRRESLEGLFSSVGQVMTVDEEGMEHLTAITSCGPAFIATFLDLFLKSSERQGHSYDELLPILIETVMATATMMEAGNTPTSICSAVATEGGITEKGISLMRRSLPPMFDGMMRALGDEHRRTDRQISQIQ